jgi:hypothetical protein
MGESIDHGLSKGGLYPMSTRPNVKLGFLDKAHRYLLWLGSATESRPDTQLRRVTSHEANGRTTPQWIHEDDSICPIWAMERTTKILGCATTIGTE